MLTPEHRRSKRIRIPVKRYSETCARTQTLTKSNNYNNCSKSKNKNDEDHKDDE